MDYNFDEKDVRLLIFFSLGFKFMKIVKLIAYELVHPNPLSNYGAQEPLILWALILSHRIDVKEPNSPLITNLLKIVHKQVKFWKTWSCNFLTSAFFCANDGACVHVVNVQVMQCIVYYNEKINPILFV
jgi:hypothetical protein